MNERKNDNQLDEAVHAMHRHAEKASWIDRRDWNPEQWREDADRLMGDLDGSIMSLVNGHVLYLLQFWREHREGTL